jgi:hypothetical protein
MNMRRLYTLVVVWFFLLTGPATSQMLGVFGRVDTQKSVDGSVAGCPVLRVLCEGRDSRIRPTPDLRCALLRAGCGSKEFPLSFV